MGPYCQFCDHRCFVPDPTRSGHLLATCLRGQEHDRRALGYCWADVRVGRSTP